MAKSIFRIGCNKQTQTKLEDFECLFKGLGAMTANVIKRNCRAHPEMVVVDWNAGSGRYRGPDRVVLEGTPIIVARLAQRSDVPIFLICVEANVDSCLSLEMELDRYESPKFAFEVIRKRNDEAVQEIALKLMNHIQRPRLHGLQIFDPNGKPQLDLLEQLQSQPIIRDLDVLASYPTATIKWHRNVEKTRSTTRQLEEYLYECHGKEYWAIQKPRGGALQRAWFIGSDWEPFTHTRKNLHIYKIDCPEGLIVFDAINRTQQEREDNSLHQEEENDSTCDPEMPLF